MVWSYLGKGQYNYVYVDENRKRVLKIQQKNSSLTKTDLLLDSPERAVRVWNEVNFGLTEKAMLIDHEELTSPNGTLISKGIGWTAPFVQGTDSTQNEICGALVSIFNRSGRVVLDAIVPGNFKTVPTPTGPQVICVDVGMSLKLQKETNLLRKGSVASLEVWQTSSKSSYLPWFRNYQNHPSYNEVIGLTKALFTLQQKFPFITNADFLRKPENKDLKEALAKKLDSEGPITISPQLLKKFQAIQEAQLVGADPNTLVHVAITTADEFQVPEIIKLSFDAKKTYLAKLDQYINSRGCINEEGHFTPSLITKVFRNEDLTYKKIMFSLELKKKINEATSLEELQSEVKKALMNTKSSSPNLFAESTFFKSALKHTLNELYNLIDRSILEENSNLKPNR